MCQDFEPAKNAVSWYYSFLIVESQSNTALERFPGPLTLADFIIAVRLSVLSLAVATNNCS